jgi:hypothetical protein
VSRTIRIELPQLHAAQASIAADRSRFRVVVCGRRFGKTELAKTTLIRSALRGFPVAYFAPSYKLLAQTWREIVKTVTPVADRVSNGEFRIELMGGGSVDAWSLDRDDAALGRKYKFVVIDEAARVRHPNVWYEAIRPTLADYQGSALFLSTPRGRNWLWALWLSANSPTATDWKTFSFPTSANPYISAAEIESARATMPDRLFRQEFLAEFIDDRGAVFRNVYEVSTAEPVGPVAGSSYVFGVDFGRHNDFTAVSVFNVDTKTQVYLDRFTETSFAVQRARIAALAAKYRPTLILAELNSIGEPNVEQLIADGLPVQGFYTTAASKGPLIDALAVAIEDSTVTLLDDSVQINELLSYEMDRLPSGRYTYSAPSGLHDDTVIATALAWRAVQQIGASEQQSVVTLGSNKVL